MTGQPTMVSRDAATLPVDARVAAVCDRIIALAGPGATADEARSIRARLDGPLRVAMAGRAKAGKSTLLNALVGERLAATDAGECTRIVTVYGHHASYSVTGVGRDGSRSELAFRRRDGAIEVDLGGRRSIDLSTIEVGWPSLALRDVTLVDTPGLASTDDASSLRTRDFLALEGQRASDVDAVIYLMRHVHRTDAEFLDAFLDRSIGNVSPVNAVAVLSRADEIGAARLDAMDSARRIAERYRVDPQLRPLCSSVLPIAGLLAESGQTLREDEAASLRTIAGSDPADLAEALSSVDRFAEGAGLPLTIEGRRELLARLGLYGVRLVMDEFGRRGPLSGPEVARVLVDASGLAGLRRTIAERLQPRARALKARSALAALRSLGPRLRSEAPRAADVLEADLERVAAGAHEFAELRVAHLVLAGDASVSDEEREEILRLTAPLQGRASRLGLAPDASDGDQRASALDAITRWRIRADDPRVDPDTREAAEIAARSYEGIYTAIA